MNYIVLLIVLFLAGCSGKNEDYASIYFEHSAAFDKSVEILIIRESDSTWISEWTLSLDDSTHDSSINLDNIFDPNRNKRIVKERDTSIISKPFFEKIKRALSKIDPRKIREGTLIVGADGVGWTIRGASWKGYTFQYNLSIGQIKQKDKEIEDIVEFADLMFESTGHKLSDYYRN